MLVIITGASGFVGKNLNKFLINNGYNTSLLSLRNSKWKLELEKDAHAIIHLAGKAHDTNNSSNPEDYFKINKDLTVELFDEFLKSNIRDFFYFSSVKAIADSVEGVLFEDNIPNPKSPYGKSKLEAENYLLSQKLPYGKRLFIIRPCMIHGPGNKGNLNLLYNIVKKGIPWPLGSFENERSFLSIDNLNFLLFELLKNVEIKSDVFNFSDDKTLSTNKLVSLIGEVLGESPKILFINKRLIENISKIGDKIKLPLNSERLNKLTENYVVSNQKVKLKLGISELPIKVEDGLRKTIQSFKSKF